MLYRRARALVAYWECGTPMVRNYARGTTALLTASVLDILQALENWRGLEALNAAGVCVDQGSADRLTELVANGIVESTATPLSDVERGLDAWADWSPSAAYFHFDTKDVVFADRATTARGVARRLLLDPPAPRMRGAAAIALPRYDRRGAFPTVLLSRRSWRRFGAGALTLSELAAILGLTWGTQHWIRLGEGLEFPLKTSPSGGACHSLEVYVVATRVEGLEAGVYHYDADSHGLDRIGKPWTADDLAARIGKQRWVADAAAVFFITSVFPRVRWKYKFARAYRAVLLEAGHFCQTFCLVATWLKLAPFCTAALADSAIERALGVDGVTESVLYAMGVGRRPGKVSWAPRSDPESVPVLRPAHARKRIRRTASRGRKDTS